MEALLHSVEKTMENFTLFMNTTVTGFELMGKVFEKLQNEIYILGFWCLGITVWLAALSWRSRKKE
jgi:hypothetical protein